MSSAEIEGVPGARVGEIFNGKYRVEKVLGAGGMGVVVAATHLQLDEKVAIKFLLPDAAKSADTVNRFQREARAAVKIKSEHVARVSDVGQLENGSPFMVMEFLQGKDLAETVEHGPLPVQAAVEYVLQACEAMDMLDIVYGREDRHVRLTFTYNRDISGTGSYYEQDGEGKILKLDNGAQIYTATNVQSLWGLYQEEKVSYHIDVIGYDEDTMIKIFNSI